MDFIKYLTHWSNWKEAIIHSLTPEKTYGKFGGNEEAYDHWRQERNELLNKNGEIPAKYGNYYFDETEDVGGVGNVLQDIINDVKRDKEYNRTLF